VIGLARKRGKVNPETPRGAIQRPQNPEQRVRTRAFRTEQRPADMLAAADVIDADAERKAEHRMVVSSRIAAVTDAEDLALRADLGLQGIDHVGLARVDQAKIERVAGLDQLELAMSCELGR